MSSKMSRMGQLVNSKNFLILLRRTRQFIYFFLSKILTAVFFTSIVFIACTKKIAHHQTETNANPEASVVNLSIWGNYLSPEMQAKFEKETGIKINISNYSSSEELLTKVQMGSSGIDVAVPSDYMVGIMRKMNLLEPLNPGQIANKELIDSKFLMQTYDPENKFSLPYTWTTVGIAVNRKLYKGKITSWKDFFENPELSGKLAMLDDSRETIAAALIMNGASANSVSKTDLDKAKLTLFNAKKNMKMFTSDTIDILKNKEVIAAQTYSSDALQAAAQTAGDIEYIIPKEGSTIAIDNLVIVKGAKHVEAAHKLINFLISQEVELNKVNIIRGGPVLRNTRALLGKELSANKVLFPENKALNKLEFIRDLEDQNKQFEDIWTQVKTN